MPSPVTEAVQNASDTSLTSTGTNGVWKLLPSDDPNQPNFAGWVHWHFESSEAGHRGTVTITTPTGVKTFANLITCTNVYIDGETVVITGEMA